MQIKESVRLMQERLTAGFDIPRVENLNNPTLADVYFGRRQATLDRRAKTKREVIALQRQLHQKAAA
ncbi:MAG: hypothetical protein V5B40_19330 [Candidatus Accumulibacter meliphilus]|jgi:hypothetical protein|uniref:hypothetical protein n=1 Tax=Candidatus Accumulibacter meliphilus TaxID=2211374 RepID=UPI002FC2E122